MDEKPDPVNPWLAEAILAFRKKYPDDKIRELYRAILCLAPNKPWETFISEQALVLAARENPFLRTPVESLELPEATQKLLHLFLVEYVIDLIQITEEELVALLEGHEDKIPAIRQCLEAHGLRLRHHNGFTAKYGLPSK